MLSFKCVWMARVKCLLVLEGKLVSWLLSVSFSVVCVYIYGCIILYRCTIQIFILETSLFFYYVLHSLMHSICLGLFFSCLVVVLYRPGASILILIAPLALLWKYKHYVQYGAQIVAVGCTTYYLSNQLGLSKRLGLSTWLGPFNRLNSLEKKVEEISADLKVVKEKIISLSDDVEEIKGRVDAATVTKATVAAYPWLIKPGQLLGTYAGSFVISK